MLRRVLLPRLLLACAALVLSATPAAARTFAEAVGPVAVGPAPSAAAPLRVPFLTWGGDMATFFGNGGVTTVAGSLFHKQGIQAVLVPGDDIVQQAREYVSGKSPFFRATMGQLGLAAELLAKDPRTQPAVFLQLTWSIGDHSVARPGIHTVADLKGKAVALQEFGPHVGMLDDMLRTAGLGWKDIRVVWCKDLTGSPQSPAEVFRARPDVGVAFVITPDMVGLTGGVTKVGTGAEGTVKGAKVLVSTAELSRSIADVYAVRKDFYDANKDLVHKFAAAWLRSVEVVLDLKRLHEKGKSPEYKTLLQLTQTIYGKATIPTLEDAHGLLSDAQFVGHPGNVDYFTGRGNLHGFQAFEDTSVAMGIALGYARAKVDLLPSPLDWNGKAFVGYLQKTQTAVAEGFQAEVTQKEIEQLTSGGGLDERTLYSFTIAFEPNQNEFPLDKYGADFDKAIRLADKYAGAVVAVRGHADPTQTLFNLVAAGMKKGVLTRTGASGSYQYFMDGKPLDLSSVDKVVHAIQTGKFDGVAENNPRQTMQAAQNLALQRAENVKRAVLAFARAKGMRIDGSQLQPQGVGIREPVIAKPANLADAKQNMRVEFTLVRVSAEAARPADFDF